ncbi:unnamed protein product [Tuber melanosporum]|uniref:(Perigord truffle) hypothetical protein n=1 Tax=Tuber melanosporum (strain Mel28) TaxID=656061 RepID=D5G8Y0_TUBMM|nr:uncharacterized protein GSTUM_00004891001 [Tuber melanosporum]CAZ80973.1 unnamed protein product [Tuber melanosporum]
MFGLSVGRSVGRWGAYCACRFESFEILERTVTVSFLPVWEERFTWVHWWGPWEGRNGLGSFSHVL